MLRRLFFVTLGFLGFFSLQSQVSSAQLTHLKMQLQQAGSDSIRAFLLNEIAVGYRFSNVDSAQFYADEAIKVSAKPGLERFGPRAMSLKGMTMLDEGRLAESLQLQYDAMALGYAVKDTVSVASALNRIGNIYMELGDLRKAIDFYQQSGELAWKFGETGLYYNEISNIGNIYEQMGMPDSALYFLHQIEEAGQKNREDRYYYVWPEIYLRLGNAWKRKGDFNRAMGYYRKGILESEVDNDIRNLTMNDLELSRVHQSLNRVDSGLHYAYNALSSASKISFRRGMHDSYELLSELYRAGKKTDSTLKYVDLAEAEQESLFGAKRIRALEQIVLRDVERKRDEEKIRLREESVRRQIILIAALAVFLLIALLLYRNNRHKQLANEKLASTLGHLKSAQAQLVQSEKMASLGELTAGIAHEIQNPLNFVNNFSDLNREMIDELKDELKKGDLQQASVLVENIRENEEKINLHGRRADGIVKSMLQHSRSSGGQKEPTDVNKLVDEYVRLAYHGYRARQKDFNVKLEIELDPAAGKVRMVKQDIGRVILNLLNNAFYAVHERTKISGSEYAPTVWIRTRVDNREAVTIEVADNGPGIQEPVREKIFQPFFTTKPTGQGTGLGLSLSYDIVTKGHGGTMHVDSEAGQGTKFAFSLPTA